MKRVKTLTLLWLRDKPYEASTEFAVVETPDVKADKPVQVDIGTADLWVRQGKAEAAGVTAAKAA